MGSENEVRKGGKECRQQVKRIRAGKGEGRRKGEGREWKGCA